MRKSLLCAAAAAALAFALARPAAAQTTLYVAAYGGSFEQTMRRDVIPPFEKQHGVKIEYVAGNSTDTLAKLQAQKGNQQIDVAIVDDGPMYQRSRSASAVSSTTRRSTTMSTT
jgi:putative spermidine/putrescine transport system substrate-binding protein